MQGSLETHVGLGLLFLIFSCVKLASSPTHTPQRGNNGGCGGGGGGRGRSGSGAIIGGGGFLAEVG
jgi:hypothetical protein